ncbi:hypothetical protein [Streptosporangium sp. NPDC004631]
MQSTKWSIIAASFIVTALGATSPTIANADTPPPVSNNQSDTSPTLPGEPEVTAEPGSAFSGVDTEAAENKVAADVVGCYVRAEAPFTLVYNKPPIRAEGYIPSCTPTKPDDCRTETDLELNINGTWTVIANGPVKWGCNIGSGSKSSTSYNCSHANGPHHYRTRTYLIAKYKGVWASEAAVATSGQNSWWCQ